MYINYRDNSYPDTLNLTDTDAPDLTDISEPAVLAGLNTDGSREEFEHSLEEMRSLAQAAYMSVRETFTQSLPTINAATYIGAGKAEEIRAYLKRTGITTVLIDSQISPMQMKNLSDILDARIIDRTDLILRIFSDRARTREARLQVEYARLQYILPRLAGMHAELGRQGGTSGAMSNRGAGETKIELDRRKISHRIHEIRRELDAIENERETQRKHRLNSTLPRIALTGYTNAGKSTILNRMLYLYGAEYGRDSGKMVFEKDMLFATLDTTVRKIVPGNNRLPFLLSDTVGFISDLPATLVKAFRSTLDETRYADLLLIVTDVSDPDYKKELEITIETLNEIGAGSIPRIIIYNKADLLQETRDRSVMSPQSRGGEKRITISARSDEDMERLVSLIEESINESRKECEMLIPYSDGYALNSLMNSSHVDILEYTDTGTRIHVFCRPDDYRRYREYITV